jgi:hypothetical protein
MKPNPTDLGPHPLIDRELEMVAGQFDTAWLERVRPRCADHPGPSGAVFARPLRARLRRLARTLRGT